MKKLLSIILTILMLVTSVPFAFAADETPPTRKIDGKTYYELDSADDLYWFAEQVNVNKNDTINAILTADIVINENLMSKITVAEDGTATINEGETVREWTPIKYFINSDMVGYKGIFDGSNHTISGLYGNSDDMYYMGFFALANGATIKNLGIIDSYFYEYQNVASVVALARNTTIINCFSENCLIANESQRAGGIAGKLYNSNIIGCYNASTIRESGGGSYFIGGIVGESVSTTISDCFNTGSIVATGDMVGGIVGCINSSSAVVENCYNIGKINSDSEKTGGIAGENWGSVIDCYFNSEIFSGSAIGINEGSAVSSEGKTALQFASGEVAYAFGSAWGQKLGTDPYPVLGSTDTVYRVATYTKCDMSDVPVCEYNNTSGSDINNAPQHVLTGEIICMGKLCEVCGKYYGDADESKHLLSWKTAKEATCAEPGLEIYACEVCGNAPAMETVLCDSATYPESGHNYHSKANEEYAFSYPGATKLVITFSEDTETEKNYDFIYIYDSTGTEYGKYSGTELAGVQIDLEGGSFKIKLTSDVSGNRYGFRLASVYATAPTAEYQREIPALSHNWSNKNGICAVCGVECEHDWSNADGICTVCNYECNHDDFADGKCPDCGAVGTLLEISMYDSYGDGWNGNKLLIKNTSGEEIGVATFDEGYDDTYTFLLAEDVKFTLTWQEGSYADECTFEVAVDGETVFESENGDAYEDGEVVYTNCAHTFEDGVCTKCDLVCEHDTDNGTCSICGEYVYAITHQPTEAEPYVELNDDTDATYQWYKVEGMREITDENADTVSYDWGDSSYDAETGWTGVPYNEGGDGHDFFTVALNAGDTVIIELTGDFYDYVGLYDYSTEEDFGEDVESGVNTYEITVPDDGNYTLYTFVDSGAVTVKAYMDDLACSAIEGETGAALSNPTYGNRYLCEVTFADGTTEKSDILDLTYRITHQPTEAEPYVELNDDTDASYQWYVFERKTVEITDENATALTPEFLGMPEDMFTQVASYDAENGWQSSVIPQESGNGLLFFITDLKAGDVVNVTFSAAPDDSKLLTIDADKIADAETEDGINYSFTVLEDGLYGLQALSSELLYAKASMLTDVSSIPEGETDARLQSMEYGKKYFCEVTFADGTTEKSDILDFSYRITHQPTAGEPYVELNDDTDATYQWYEIEYGTIEITDENATVLSGDIRDAEYVPGEGWHIGLEFEYADGSYLIYGFERDFEAGDQIILDVTTTESDPELWLGGSGDFNYVGFTTDENGRLCATIEQDDTYGLFSGNLYDPDMIIKAYLYSKNTPVAIESQTDSRLQNPEFGEEYFCEVTFADGTSEVSDSFEYKYAITHHPTEEEPYVELNDNTDASYQWYTVEDGIVEITDAEATGSWSALGAPSELHGEYDSEIGWISSEGYYFVIELQEGETVELEASESVSEWWIAYAQNPGMYTDEWTVEQYGTTISFTATADGYYGFSISDVSGVAVRAYMDGSVYTAVDGQTTDTLTPDTIGQYACKVTFADGTTEMSDAFEVTSVHTCDFSGDWVYDTAKHWKECTVDGCSVVAEEGTHTFLDGECTVCDYVCDHANATEELNRPVQNADGTWGQGSIVTTCPDCGNVDTESVDRADYTAFDAAVAKLQEILASGNLIDGPKATITTNLNNVIDEVGYNRAVVEQTTVNDGAQRINGYIAMLEAGLADGTMKKADLSYMTALLDEVNALIDSNPNNIVSSEVGNYSGPYSYYRGQINNGNLTQADHDRNMAAYDYENQLETLLAGLKDGTMRKADYTEIDEVIAGIDEALKTATVSDEMQAELDGIKKELDALKSEVNTSAADLTNSGLLDRAKAIAATMADCANGVHVFTNYEETVAPTCKEEGKKVAFCDNGCGATDEKAVEALGHTELPAVKENEVAADCENAGSYDLVVYCEICKAEVSRTTETVDALGHTELPAVKENEVAADCENAGSYDLVVYCDVCKAEVSRTTETVEALGHAFTVYTVTAEPTCEEAGKQVSVCDNGCGATDETEIAALGHAYNDYVSNGDATCTADGTKTAECDNGCGKKDTVADEGSKLDHVDEDADEICDDCGNSIHESEEDCECTCHRDDPLNQLFNKIIQLIRRIFGINSTCECGTVHTSGLTPIWKIFVS